MTVHAELVQRREKVAELHLKGYSRDSIAVELGVGQGTVSNDLAAVRREWAETANEKLEALKDEELARLRAVDLAAWLGYQRTGSPSFLRVIIKSSEQRSKMLGLIRDVNVNIGVGSFDWDAIANGYPDPLESKLLELSDGRPPEEESLPTSHGAGSEGDTSGGGGAPPPSKNGCHKPSVA